ncbi:MAG: ABC transporter permease [Lentisphaerae bacterium]|jgi:ABC-2 type transport system permease protein|nr:ABC transporter permease [Lentisphaerota bacterium]
MLGWLRNVVQRRELVWILIERNLKIRYKSSVLGFFWSLLSPLFLIGIYSLFLGLLKFEIHLPTLVTAIIAWQFLGMCLGDALHSIVGNANLVTKSAFPRILLPFSMVGANAINFLFSFAVLTVYLLVVRADFGGVAWLPVIMLTQTALCLGMAMIVGTANVFFRDTEHVMSVVMLAWFFLSPVIYEPAMIMDGFPRWVQVAFYLNPMSGILTAYRAALLSPQAVSLWLVGMSFGVAWAVFLVGLLIFHAAEPRFGDEL